MITSSRSTFLGLLLLPLVLSCCAGPRPTYSNTSDVGAALLMSEQAETRSWKEVREAMWVKIVMIDGLKPSMGSKLGGNFRLPPGRHTIGVVLDNYGCVGANFIGGQFESRHSYVIRSLRVSGTRSVIELIDVTGGGERVVSSVAASVSSASRV